MKKSKLLASVAIAGMILGAQVAKADHHEEEGTKEGKEKNSCKGKDKNSCKGKDKNSCKGKKADGANACSGPNGCDGKEHPAAPEKPKAQ